MRRKVNPLRKFLTVVFAAVLGVSLLAACDTQPSSQDEELATQQSGYDQLVASQPAKNMTYSPTRETINFWIEQWNEPGKVSYVYLTGANGQKIGYFVLEGLPVSYCASLSPTYTFQEIYGDGTNARRQLPAPALDGVFYSGGQCNQYYGKDATTGAFIEFSIGGSQNYLLFDQPLPVDVEPLGFTTIEDLQE